MPITSWEGGWAFPQDIISELEAASRTELDKVLKKARAELPTVEALFYNGDPRDSILKAAEDTKAEMIVIGTHGRRGLTRALLGSVAEAVLRRANAVVVTVRQPDKA
jgi:nucleotide-binding universal stress UspA family protein